MAPKMVTIVDDVTAPPGSATINGFHRFEILQHIKNSIGGGGGGCQPPTVNPGGGGPPASIHPPCTTVGV